jgi:thiamine biosynthesis lipoprotein
MGTVVNLTVLGEDPGADAAAADAALERMARLEALLSRYDPRSEVSALNRGETLHQASGALLDVLRLADRVSGMGDGALDVTVQPLLDLYRRQPEGSLPSPDAIEQTLERVDRHAVKIDGSAVTLAGDGMRLTLDGIGKGYIVDRGVETLVERGFPNVLVEAGGDLMAAGDRGAGEPWRIGLRSPRRGLALHARLHTRNSAVATSGDYMQPFTSDLSQHHILDPRTGRSAPELASSTVVAPDAATADALATLTMVLGPRRGRELLEELPGCEGHFVSKQVEITRTSGWGRS